MDLFKTDKITPKGRHIFSGEFCHPFGIEYCVNISACLQQGIVMPQA
jgi:hypothetical protein